MTATGRIGRGDQGRGGREIGRAGRSGRGKCCINRNHRKPDNANFARRIINLYCWTHGGCNHVFNNFTRKSQGHMDNVTMDNHLAGSNSFFQPVEDSLGETDDDSKHNDKINMTFTTEMPIDISNPIVSQLNKNIKGHLPALQSNNYVVSKGDSVASHH